MLWKRFRRSKNVEDYRDPNKPLAKSDELAAVPRTLKELRDDTNSQLARSAQPKCRS